ncbi:acyl-CoA dehydrogenase family protein [Streptomyces sp. NRRL S-481]|uniref:acyl-CoA dehydrogenase family protein n=1 Tax=Streptomyces sp. NRRL S-481 TaxID=1463911 RepID=UPI001F2BFBD0|nr:acyl-CoA dehydrogenase family protein [Streptomyces sp. NRRL S-481]
MLAGSPGPGRSRCHTAPAHLGTGLLLCAPALGAARHALREWTAWAARRGAGRLSERATLQLTLAQSADDIEAAELLLGDAALRADSGTRAERDVARNRRVAHAAAPGRWSAPGATSTCWPRTRPCAGRPRRPCTRTRCSPTSRTVPSRRPGRRQRPGSWRTH